MLESLPVTHIPCFSRSGPDPLALKPVNFIFGPNGSGKSSIAKEFRASRDTPDANLKVMLYDRSYKDAILQKADSLKGLLTVGSGAMEAQGKIDTAKEELAKKIPRRTRLEEHLSNPDGETEGKQQERARLENTIRDVLWSRRFKEVPQKSRTGLFPRTGTKESFAQSHVPAAVAMYERGGPEKDIEPLSAIVERYGQLQSTKGAELPEIAPDLAEPSIDEDAINKLLAEPIINEGKSTYAQSISVLEAESWFKRGLALMNETEPNCPFCQRKLGESVLADIKDAFSDEYNGKMECLEQQRQLVDGDIQQLEEAQSSLPETETLDISGLEKAILALRDYLREVTTHIAKKKESPTALFDPISAMSQFETLLSERDKINGIIKQLNDDAANHKKVENELIGAAVPALLADTWVELEPHLEAHSNNLKAENGLKEQLSQLESQITELKSTIDDESRKVRDSKVHLDNINSLISYMAGDAFRLVSTNEGDAPSNYRVVRGDGNPVESNLSEGEEQLLAFLYFISEIWNIGQEGSDIEASRAVVVIDDPMSSLDSDLLFGVSSLIIDLIDGAKTGKYQIAQLTCLSHNASFYNNVAFRFSESNDRFQHFLIRKKNFGFHEVAAVEQSPVTSVYANLWRSVKRAESAQDADNVSLANTMRRILENYFSAGNSLGGLSDLDELERTDQVAINSLVSWANAGSHNLMDSLEIGLPDIGVSTYLRVFRRIFEATGHDAHYKMMMGTSNATE